MIYVFLIFKKKKTTSYDLSFLKILKSSLSLRFFYLSANFISFFLEVWILFIYQMIVYDQKFHMLKCKADLMVYYFVDNQSLASFKVLLYFFQHSCYLNVPTSNQSSGKKDVVSETISFNFSQKDKKKLLVNKSPTQVRIVKKTDL